MPFEIKTIADMRRSGRDAMVARLPGTEAAPPNSRLRFITDNNAAGAHLNLLFLDWLSKQLLPDTAEVEWLERHANIWLTNADGSIGRKTATFAIGTVTVTGLNGTVLPTATRLAFGEVLYETTQEIVIGVGATPVTVEALTLGVIGNQDAGAVLSIVDAVAGVNGSATVVAMTGGLDAESDEDLRTRVLERIRQPPMGGAAPPTTTSAGPRRSTASPAPGPRPTRWASAP
jgi:uncharacterized phage protein gp47/JayE